MTDDAPKIIPFGKYKGRLIEEVLVDDPAYLQWLAGQEVILVRHIVHAFEDGRRRKKSILIGKPKRSFY